MATTTYKGAYLPAVAGDSGTWGDKMNSSLTNSTFKVFDANLGGLVSKTLTNSDVTLTAAESQNAVIRLTGTLSDNVQVTTECQGFHFVENLCTLGAYAVTVKNDTAATTATVPYGRWAVVFDDTNGARVIKPEAASSTARGIVELATDAEVQTGTDTDRAVTPAGLQACTATETRAGVIELATDAEVQAGTDTDRAVTPAGLQACSATETRAGVVEIATEAEMEAQTSDKVPDAAILQHHPGVAKAWINLSQYGAQSITDSHNVSSITDSGLGETVITFSTAFADENYVYVGSGRDDDSAGDVIIATDSNGVKSTTQIEITCTNSGANEFNTPELCAAFFGTQ